ncbi:MBOAT family O-acyltransferase [Qipengyuania marisflavi]|uniref:Probable alginate O-acetylase AlgI n=1 Tax=Qipengyuania marisflavi TaxID=2486356 RepID=A0A5S3P876_9SPHN|nr:MBOAT family O-acyltransferase [Qipengyuania marisflavi]TMM49702.1 MBOAT family protein [Qipengyuania marisflavi]
MSFHSIEYLLFLPLAVAVFFFTPHHWRWLVLVVLSMLFYASWRVEFLSLLLFSTTLDYGAARLMPHARRPWKMALMGLSMAGNIGLLIAFKFFTQIANDWFSAALMPDQSSSTPMLFLLPLGISFYTFQTLSYTIDVYRGKRLPERHLGHFAAYVMFFPQLIAGPIERFGTLMPQLKREQVWDWNRSAAGGGLFLIGLYKKLVIADGLGPLLTVWVAGAQTNGGAYVLTIAGGTMYRYYADLSGYADMAIGSALLMGIKLTQNFRRPFAAKSVAQFWQRWHTTVSNWFRDYVYVPLVKKMPAVPGARFAAIMLTMILVGIWHGATANWIAIGIISGFLIAFSNRGRKILVSHTSNSPLLRRSFDHIDRVLLWAAILVFGTLVAFREVDPALAALARLPQAPAEIFLAPREVFPFIPMYLLGAIMLLEIYQWLDARASVHERLITRPRWISWGFYLALIAAIIMFGSYDNPSFLYFQF